MQQLKYRKLTASLGGQAGKRANISSPDLSSHHLVIIILITHNTSGHLSYVGIILETVTIELSFSQRARLSVLNKI